MVTHGKGKAKTRLTPTVMARGGGGSPAPRVSFLAPALASLLHHFSSSPADVDGLLLGHRSPSGDDTPTVTGFFFYGRPMAFYNPLGRVDRAALFAALSLHHWPRSCALLGWFSGRRRSAPRPSMREIAVSASLAGVMDAVAGELGPDGPVHCVFVLLSSPADAEAGATDYGAYVTEASSDGGAGSRRPHREAVVDVVDVDPPGFGGLCNSVSLPAATAPHGWRHGMPQQVQALEDTYITLMKLRREGEGRVEEVLKQLSTLKIESVHEGDQVEHQHLLKSVSRDQQELERVNQHRMGEDKESNTVMPHCSGFSYTELREATDGFHCSQKVGEGGYGSVYKGFLRHTVVAVKKLDPESMQGLREFHQELDILSRVRHPNLVTLMGACPSPEPCLVYEFLPNGSLEDRLLRPGGDPRTPPLSWQSRVRIATEVCSALIFLHSHRPHAVVHGDLKPSNILLDAHLVAKLGDFGLCRLLPAGIRRTEPKGTFLYVDPEFGYTGELTPSSDIYSFGVVLLQLLTGKPALGVVKAVQDALFPAERLQGVMDVEWPFLQAMRLARLGLQCCQTTREGRPRLEEVWVVLEPMMRASSLKAAPVFQKERDGNSHAPSYFLCPILQEVMKDPQIAADGFTYEAEAIKGWFDGGHDTSPMTNVQLPHCDLLANHALRSVIQEWLQQQGTLRLS